MKIYSLLRKYPKRRGNLPKPIKKIFDNEYLNNRQNFLSQLSERWLHLSMDDRKIKKKHLK